jgi:hypothetical protein
MTALHAREVRPGQWVVELGDQQLGRIVRTRRGRPGYELDSFFVWPNDAQLFVTLRAAMEHLAARTR